LQSIQIPPHSPFQSFRKGKNRRKGGEMAKSPPSKVALVDPMETLEATPRVKNNPRTWRIHKTSGSKKKEKNIVFGIKNDTYK